jgi:beta-glucanase (GH16 family)
MCRSSFWRPLSLAGLISSFFLLAGCWVIHNPIKEQPLPGWTLTWSDEFSEPDGSPPDPKEWTYSTGGGGWGNHELESYTNRLKNARIENGSLVITARQEDYTGADGITRAYTSARLKTQDLFSQTYGRFEARIKIPEGQGIWPAFWMLGTDLPKVGWPQCGEIDVMENIGKEPGVVHGSLHAPGANGKPSELTSAFKLRTGRNFADDFHIYAVEWEPEVIRFYVDSNQYATFTSSDWAAGGAWKFDHPFFRLLNVAVGGDWPGNPDANTKFPQNMLVDYVRVYTRH